MHEQVDVVFDVDGVWNAFPPEEHARALGRPWPPAWGWECEPTEVRIERFRITYSTALVARVHDLVARPEVTPYWLTTWCDSAPERLCPAIGLEGSGWPVLGKTEYLDRTIAGWWKHPAIQQHVEGTDHRVIWIDDDLAFDSGAQQWVGQMNTDEPRVLGIAPETHVGLTLHHLDLIEHWIDTGEVQS